MKSNVIFYYSPKFYTFGFVDLFFYECMLFINTIWVHNILHNYLFNYNSMLNKILSPSENDIRGDEMTNRWRRAKS